MIGGDEGAAAGELKRRGPGSADDARAGGKLQRAGAIAAGGQLERGATTCGFVDGRLQYRSLIDGAAGDEAEVGPGSRARAPLLGAHPRLRLQQQSPRP
jgi:hypothetical protein